MTLIEFLRTHTEAEIAHELRDCVPAVVTGVLRLKQRYRFN